MADFTTVGITKGGRVGPQVLGHQGPRLVLDHSDVPKEYDAETKISVCPLDAVFTEPSNPIILFGTPNTALIVPSEDGSGWDRFAAFMFWREETFITSTKGRVQAGVMFEILGLPRGADFALRKAMSGLVGTRKASCAHSVALALHRAGFTSNGKSLKRIYRPSRLASILWRNGLEYRGMPVELRLIQTDKSVPDHFVAVWKREYTAPGRLYKKVYGLVHGHDKKAPVFEPTESVEMDGSLWDDDGPRIRVGVSIPSPTGVNLGFLLGEQPEFVAELPGPLDDPRLQPLQAYPGPLDRATKLKRYILFSKPVIWFLRKHLVHHVEWLRDEVPVRAAAAMLRRSPGPERNEAFVYNIVITDRHAKLKRLLNDNGRDNKIIAWLLAKHVLLSGYSKKVLIPGEVWEYLDADDEIVMCYCPNSGTYKPSSEVAEAAVELLGKLFQTRVVLVPM